MSSYLGLIALNFVWLVGDWLDDRKLLPRRVKAAHTALALKLDLVDPL